MTQQHTSVDGSADIIYQETTVVSFNNNRITLRSGGWETRTTKRRMNQASAQFSLGYSVFQKNYEWFVDFESETLEFEDGMILNRTEVLS